MKEGWIKLHRQWFENPIAQKPYYGHLWITLLLKAAHKHSEFIWNNDKHLLKPGQLMTGRKKLSEQTGIPESTVERILKYLENEQQIEQQKTNKFRIITIKNWEKYQGYEKANIKTDNKRTTDGQQMDTYNNDNNVKNDNKESIVPFAEFWKIYPKKVGKGAARRAFQKIKPSDELLQKMIAALEQQKKSEQWRKEAGRFIPNPATWLNQERWLDELGHKETTAEQVARMEQEGKL